MKYLCVLLVALIAALGATIWELESRPPEVVYIEPADELPWAIFIDHCDDLYALIWTTEPPTWFTPDDDFNREQFSRMDKMYRAGQTQLVNICSQEST